MPEMKKIVRYISSAFILLWIIGVVYRTWFIPTSGGLQYYTTLDAITDGSLIIGIIGFIVSAFIKKPAEEKNE
jgi:hypothetical protein